MTSPWRRAALVINRGSRQGAAALDQAAPMLNSAGLRLASAEGVDGDRLGDRIAELADGGADLIIVGGGDGTLRVAAELLVGRETTLGVLPLGTGNNLARDLNLPLDLAGACRALAGGAVRRIECGEATFEGGGRHTFVNAAHLGLCGDVNAQLKEDAKRRFRYVAYLYGAWRAYAGFCPFSLRIESSRAVDLHGVMEVSAVMGRIYAGGLGQLQGESLDDGRMTLAALRRDRPVLMLRAAWRLLRSPHTTPGRSRLYRVDAARLIASPPQEVNLDGEILGTTPVTLRVVPGALRVIAGPTWTDSAERPSGPAKTALAAAAAGAAGGLIWTVARRRASGRRGQGIDPVEQEARRGTEEDA